MWTGIMADTIAVLANLMTLIIGFLTFRRVNGLVRVRRGQSRLRLRFDFSREAGEMLETQEPIGLEE